MPIFRTVYQDGGLHRFMTFEATNLCEALEQLILGKGSGEIMIGILEGELLWQWVGEAGGTAGDGLDPAGATLVHKIRGLAGPVQHIRAVRPRKQPAARVTPGPE